MGWVIYLRDKAGTGQKYTSSILETREHAFEFARALLQAGDLEVVEIRNHDGEKIDLAHIHDVMPTSDG